MKSKLNAEQIAQAKAMRAKGWSLTRIARVFRVSINCLHCAIDPEFADQRREKDKARGKRIRHVGERCGRRAHGIHVVAISALPDEERRARQAAIPEDTRSLSARLMGEPLPGRSALDKQGRGG